jgi:hypothetical protein
MRVQLLLMADLIALIQTACYSETSRHTPMWIYIIDYNMLVQLYRMAVAIDAM